MIAAPTRIRLPSAPRRSGSERGSSAVTIPYARRRDPESDQAIQHGLGDMPGPRRSYSHSIVLGGFDEMSSATRFTAGISLMIRLEIVSSRS